MSGETISEKDDLDEQETLNSELGAIGVKTLDGDKIKAHIRKVDILDKKTVRIWYQFPTGGAIPERFEKPIPWSLQDNQLARIIDYSTHQPATFSEFITPSGEEIILEQQQIGQEDIDLEELQEAAPGELYISDQLEKEEPIKTWRAADPKDLVDDYRYKEGEEETGANWVKKGKNHFKKSLGPSIAISFLITGILLLLL